MASKWLKTLNMDYDLKVGSIVVHEKSIQEITTDQYSALSSNAIFSDLTTKGKIVVSNSKPDDDALCFVRPIGGDVTLNGMPVNNNGVPSITLGEAVKEIDAIESNKSVEIDASTYTEPIVIKPSSGKDAMKKVTVSVTNIPAPTPEDPDTPDTPDDPSDPSEPDPEDPTPEEPSDPPANGEE